MDKAELTLLSDALRRTMAARGNVSAALTELGWPDLLTESPEATNEVFRLLGETGAHAPLLNDVILGQATQETVPLPYAGGKWVVWERSRVGGGLDPELPLRVVPTGDPIELAAGRRALGWWLTGTSRAMLNLARTHALDRIQFGRPIAAFQAVRHRLAETLVAIEGAEATLVAATDDLGALLAKAATGEAALTAARNCQQVLGGIGFTAEHDFHHHARRALVLNGLLGNARELTAAAGETLRQQGSAPRLIHL